MAVLRIILFLCNVLYVTSYLKQPIPSWTEPMISKYGSLMYNSEYLPKTDDSAKVKKWVHVKSDHHKNVKLYCPSADGTLCTLHDKNGQIVGVMLAVPRDDTKTAVSPYRYAGSPWFKLRTISSKEFYTLDIYFVDQGHLDNPGEAVEVTSIGETFRIVDQSKRTSLVVPIEENKLAAADWQKQNCEDSKGTHYLYKMSNDCKDLMPVVMLVKKKHVVGFSFIIPGSYPSSYFDKAKDADIVRRFPNAPQCLSYWAKNLKISTLYVTFAPVKTIIKKCKPKDNAISSSKKSGK